MDSIKDLLLKVNLEEVQNRKKIEEIFFNLRKFKETRDFAYLENERQVGVKGNLKKKIDYSTKKSRQKEPTTLADITENVIQMENIRVKKEKISNAASSDTPLSNTSVPSTIVKTEPEDMPAPKKLLSRKKGKTDVLEVPKRSTRSRTKPRKYGEVESERVNGKSSDVVIQNVTITTIDITDTSDTENYSKIEDDNNVEIEVAHVNGKENSRSTRSIIRYVKKQASSEEASVSAESEAKKIRGSHTKIFHQNLRSGSNNSDQEERKEEERKKSKWSSSSEIKFNKTSQTEYEDAVSTLEIYESEIQNPNATYVASVDAQYSILNGTIVLKNHKTLEKHDGRELVEEKKAALQKDLRTPPKLKSKKNMEGIFSSIAKTPLKKVEAFQTLQSNFSSIPTLTKSKTSEDESVDNQIADKPKGFTPFSKKFLPKNFSTSRIKKMHPGKLDVLKNDNDNLLSEKSHSALKASQVEFRDREKRRQEKENEALKKREALLLAQSEEKRRKREEKQLKAQLQREIIEKEKHKLLEEQIRKEEKYKQTLVEKEAKLQKQKEEAEKKRQLVKKKADVIKEKEGRLKEQEGVYQRNEDELAGKLQKQTIRKKRLSSLPIYMTTQPPLLPTDDCYDSDNSGCQLTNKQISDWLKGRVLEKTLLTMQVVGEKMKNTLFSLQTHTPDLQEIFTIIDPRKLKRTSSAIWRKPPRYTIFTAASNIHFSEDPEEETHI
nr:inner centromere protein-like [Leptinotarsa decemlineata]